MKLVLFYICGQDEGSKMLLSPPEGNIPQCILSMWPKGKYFEKKETGSWVKTDIDPKE